MKAITNFFIENSKFTLILTLFFFIFGMQGLSQMNSESFPAVDFAQAQITTVYDGASAKDIETLITKPIEDEIRTVSGVKDVRSTSQSGLSTIFIRVDMDEVQDVGEVMADLQRAADRVSGLPTDLKDNPIFTEIKSEEFPVLELAIIGSNEDRLRDTVADQLKEEFEDNKSVKSARLTGFAPRRFQVQLDYEKLEVNHIGVNEVLDKISARNINIPGGSLKEIDSQKLIRLEGKIINVKELEEIIIRSNFTGQKIYLKDIAKVEDSKEEIKTLTRYNGEDATLIIVSKKSGTDTIAMVKDLKKRLINYEKIFGDKLKFKIYHNESIKVENKLSVLASNAVSGLLLVIIFLFIFLPGKVGIVASLSLPIAIMGTVGMMPKFGMNLNAITILALVIALGMLVDNSVVISENFVRLRREGMDALEAAKKSIADLWLPITATAFTTIAAFLPMLVTKGIMGQFIRFIPIVVTFSLILSLIESFFLLPMRLVFAGKSIKSGTKEDTDDWFHWFQYKFEAFMKVCVNHRYIVAIIFIGILITSSYFMGVKNKFILFPPDQTEMYIARIEMEKGTRIEGTHLSIEKLSKDIKDALGKDVDHVVGRAGVSQIQPNDPKGREGSNVGMAIIYVTDEAKDTLVYTTALEKLRKIEWNSYAKNVSFEAQINGPPVGNDIEVTFRSNVLADIDKITEKISNELSKVDGIFDLKVNDVFGDDEVFIHIDYIKADQLGLNVKNIGNTVKTAVSGTPISKVTLDNKEVDIMVRFKEPFRRNIDDLKKLEIMDARDNLVPLGSVATFELKKGSPQINRYDFKRSKVFTGSIDDTKITAIEANKKLEGLFTKYSAEYPGVSLVFGGVAESTNESIASLMDALVLSLIGIAALLVFLFKSYLRPAIIMTTIPLGLLGFSIAFYIHDRPISFLALIGIIGLGGIIVNSGIVLISFIDQMREEGKYPLDQILIKASGLRLRAVLVTSLTTISGLIPTAYGIGGSDAMLVPMTLAMAWGLTSGTILTLVWIPCAYAMLEDLTKLNSKIYHLLFRKNSPVENTSNLVQEK